VLSPRRTSACNIHTGFDVRGMKCESDFAANACSKSISRLEATIVWFSRYCAGEASVQKYDFDTSSKDHWNKQYSKLRPSHRIPD